ncbi:DinB family protein [Paenibacillus humicus]|uniref:DinB family protein n=1 Tax=Paenibacillus humicus TaxID=412861 RepID=UPI003F17BE38
MDTSLFDQLDFVRNQTLGRLQGIDEQSADAIPQGFRNSIRWNSGHLYVVLERLAFQAIGLPQQLPDGFVEQYEYGTSPSSMPESAQAATMDELIRLLQDQPDRVRAGLSGRLQESVAPYTTSTGFTLSTPEQFIRLALYHEGMHFGIIKSYRALLGLT